MSNLLFLFKKNKKSFWLLFFLLTFLFLLIWRIGHIILLVEFFPKFYEHIRLVFLNTIIAIVTHFWGFIVCPFLPINYEEKIFRHLTRWRIVKYNLFNFIFFKEAAFFIIFNFFRNHIRIGFIISCWRIWLSFLFYFLFFFNIFFLLIIFAIFY